MSPQTPKAIGEQCNKLFLKILYSLPPSGTVANPIDLDNSLAATTTVQPSRDPSTMASEGKSASWSGKSNSLSSNPTFLHSLPQTAEQRSPTMYPVRLPSTPLTPSTFTPCHASPCHFIITIPSHPNQNPLHPSPPELTKTPQATKKNSSSSKSSRSKTSKSTTPPSPPKSAAPPPPSNSTSTR